MCAPVRARIVLVRVEIFERLARRHLTCKKLSAVCAIERIGLNDLRAVNFQYALALCACILRNAECHAVASCRADHCISDTCVAARSVKNYLAGAKLARSLCFKNNRTRRAVFNRPARIQVLCLCINFNLSVKLARDVAQAYERRSANARQQIILSNLCWFF